MITNINLTLCIFLIHFYRLNLFIKKKKKTLRMSHSKFFETGMYSQQFVM